MSRLFSNRLLIAAHIAILILVIVALSTAAPTYAAGVVTNCSNDTDFSGKLAGGGVITFNCGTATIVLSSTKTISAFTTIAGDGKITLSGDAARRLFIVNNGATLDLRGMVLTGGYASDGDGGAIFNFGTLNLENSTIKDSSASNFNGGAIATTGLVDLSSSKLINNKAGNGGAIYATGNHGLVGINDSEIYNNSVNSTAPGSNRGGAFYILGDGGVSLNRSSVHNNSGGYGGAAFNQLGFLTASDTVFADNESTSGNGGAISNNGTLNFNRVTVTRNTTPNLGGGIHNVATATLTNSTISDNQANIGGGIFNLTGPLNLTDSMLVGNKATFTGGAGGGLENNHGTATLTNVTLYKNTSNGTGAGINNISSAILNLTNATLSENTAGSGSGATGGGLFNQASTANITNVTFANNSAPASTTAGGAISNGVGGTTHLHMTNIIVAKSKQGGNCNLAKTLDLDDHNLSTDATCLFGAGRDSVKIKIGKLETNGGATTTHRLLSGSKAIDSGVFVASILTDQRSVTRPRGTAFDVGAVEFVPCHGAPLASTVLSPANNAAVTTPQVTVDWAGPDCVKNYSVVVRFKNPSGAVVYSKTKLKLSQATTGTLNRGKYVWQVTACNGSACTTSPWFKFKRK